MVNILKKKRKAFTLIELLVVLIIIGILFVVLIPRINFVSDSAKTAGVKTTLRSVQAAMDHYVMLNSLLPSPVEFNTGSDIHFGTKVKGVSEDVLATSGAITSWVSYSQNDKDPWGHPYIMIREVNNKITTKIAVLSKGADGVMSPDPINSPQDDVVILFLKN